MKVQISPGFVCILFDVINKQYKGLSIKNNFLFVIINGQLIISGLIFLCMV